MKFSSPRDILRSFAARRRCAGRRLPNPRIRLRLEALEERCLLSGGISLTPSEPAPQLVGEPIAWTASVPNAAPGLVYQFSVGSPGGPFQVVRDFSPDNHFTWAPMQEGNYRIEVTVKDGFDAQDTQSAVVVDEVDSRISGDQAAITPTANPLVALYSVPPGPKGMVHVEFAVASDDPSWRSTNELPSEPSRSTNFFVAGMLPDTTYEMRDVFSDGTTSAPSLFTTGSLPSNLVFPTFTVQQPPGPGSDLDEDMIFHQLSSSASNVPNPLATDLQGRVVWYYDVSQSGLTHTYPGQSLVPGGTVLLLGVDQHAASPGTLDDLREIDLAGNVVRETNIDAVNAQLTAQGYHPIFSFTHDVERLPNGQTAVIGSTERTIDINGTPTEYVGMTIIVLDKNFQVSWVWDAFDHLDVNRGPVLGEILHAGDPDQVAASTPILPAVDWLHINAVSWSPGDGNLIVSVRHQDWVLKIDYENGEGDGHIIWRLGQGGDFTVNSTDPNPWFSHQHDAHLIDDNTLILFDNGNTRRANDPTADSRGQVWKLDESTMTATLLVNVDLGNYSPMFGAAQRLSNGDYSFTSGAQGKAPNLFSQSIEVRPDGTKVYVLKANKAEFRSFRMQTLYSGITDNPPAAVPNTLIVASAADSGAGSLRDTIAAAQNGDTIVFDSSLDGQTITLTSGELAIDKSLDIEGPGADRLTISGNGAGRVFDLTGSGADVTIAGLTIANGLAAQGGGIENAASDLTLSNDVLADDHAVGLPGGLGSGGGVYNSGAAILTIRDSVFSDNVAQGGSAAGVSGNAGPSFGGGLFNAGSATIWGTTFSGNQSLGGNGGPSGVGGNGLGAGIINEGSLTVEDSGFTSNKSIGGSHGKLTSFPTIGAGAAAGIYNVADLTVSDTSFTDNLALGGAGAAGIRGGNGNGAAILTSAFPNTPPATATISDCTFIGNQAVGGAGGAGAAGGQGSAGAVLADRGTLTIQDSTFLGNVAEGGSGSTGGAAKGGALRVAARDGDVSVLVTDSVFGGNQAIGGTASGVGGLATGGAAANIQDFANSNLQSLILRDCVVLNNEAVGGSGAVGGVARGGGISNEGGPTLTTGGISTTVIDSVVAFNLAQGAGGSAGNGGNGLGGGIFMDAQAILTLHGSTITGNEADGGTGAAGFSNGKGQGGGLYVTAGGSACADDATIIEGNSASTSDNDVFGVLGTC